MIVDTDSPEFAHVVGLLVTEMAGDMLRKNDENIVTLLRETILGDPRIKALPGEWGRGYRDGVEACISIITDPS